MVREGAKTLTPNFSPSCAWLQASLVTLMAEHITKHCLTSSSKDHRASVARLGGVTLAMCTILQKLPHMRNKETATWRSTAATPTRPESSFLDSAHLNIKFYTRTAHNKIKVTAATNHTHTPQPSYSECRDLAWETKANYYYNYNYI